MKWMIIEYWMHIKQPDLFIRIEIDLDFPLMDMLNMWQVFGISDIFAKRY